jgi:hypothetical protein
MQRQMAADDADGVEEGQRVGIRVRRPAGLRHQVPQGEVDQQQPVHLLLGEVGPARAQHQTPARQRYLDLEEMPSASHRS